MPRFRNRKAFALLLLAFSACVRQEPKLVIPPTPIGNGGRLIRELFRAAWTPPTGDRDLLRVGLVPSSRRIRFRALAPMRIRAYSESDSWEVASPEGVIWRVEAGAQIRPPLVGYLAAVRQRVLRADRSPPSADLLPWARRGFLSARWVGPVPGDGSDSPNRSRRWFLSLGPPGDRERAERLCAQARRRGGGFCRTVGRVELPPIAEGTLTAEKSTFSKPFRGFLEILSPSAPVEVLDFLPEERTGETTSESYGPRLFVVPNLEGELSLVQSTSLGNYLEGVVAAEIFPRAPAAALQAQAVVARTYTLRYFTWNGTALPYLICASTNCQVYRGFTSKQEGPSKAVRDTTDAVLREPGGGLAETSYHSICGGHTEPHRVIWGGPNREYLAGVSDQLPNRSFPSFRSDADVRRYLDEPASSFCGTSSFTRPDRWRWESVLSGAALEELTRSLGLSPPLRGVSVLRRGVSGRVLTVEFWDASSSRPVRGELEIRRLLGGLLSSLFVLDPEPPNGPIESLRIRGGGYGHGVGLCQVGAIGRAEGGQTFEEILAAYYPGTQLVPLEKSVVP